MKIAIISLSYLPKWMGGTEIATHDIAESLVRRNHDVHIITSWDFGLLNVQKESGFTIHRIRIPRIRFLELISFWIKTSNEIKSINPDVLLIQSIHTGMVGYLTKKKIGIPYVVWGQGSDVYRYWLFKRIVSYIVLKNEDIFIALTHHMGATVKRLGANRISVIPNGTKIKKYMNLSGCALREELKIKDNENVILFVGGLKIIKGLKYLIQAMTEVIHYFPETKLILAGSGPEFKNLTLQVETLDLTKNVLFLGGINHEKIPELMSAADIFVLPSLSEGFPLVAVEAMASGLPLIATDVGGLPEIIKEGETGFLVPSQDSRQLAQRIICLIVNNELMQTMRTNAVTLAKNYDWDSIAVKIEELLIDIISKDF